MPLKHWNSLYDFDSPETWLKPGDEPDPIESSSAVHYEFSRPPESKNLPNQREMYKNNKDPETEVQFPSLSLDSERPHQPPRQAYLSDQTPQSKDRIDADDDKSVGNSGDLIVSPHNKIEVQTLPDPYIEVIARSVVAEYNLNHFPVEIDLNNLSKTKVAWTLPELVSATSRKSLRYEPNCAAKFRKVRAKDYRWDMHVSCGEEWSDPTGHVVKFKFVPDNRVVKAMKSILLVSCSCEFWRYYGCDWNSLKQDYNERQMGNGAAPTIRGKNHLICKHVAACVPLIKNVFFKKSKKKSKK